MSENAVDEIILAVVLDRSGSMSTIWDDTVGGVEQLIEDQRNEEGDAWLTFAAFDNEYTWVYDTRHLDEVSIPVVPNSIKPRGTTALLDAVGKTIQHLDSALRVPTAAPRDVVVVIVTDGYENASREYTYEAVSKLIKEREQRNWTFIYLGANQDAWSTGMSLGVGGNYTFDWNPTPEDTKLMYNKVSGLVSTYRSTGNKDDLKTRS